MKRLTIIIVSFILIVHDLTAQEVLVPKSKFSFSKRVDMAGIVAWLRYNIYVEKPEPAKKGAICYGIPMAALKDDDRSYFIHRSKNYFNFLVHYLYDSISQYEGIEIAVLDSASKVIDSSGIAITPMVLKLKKPYADINERIDVFGFMLPMLSSISAVKKGRRYDVKMDLFLIGQEPIQWYTKEVDSYLKVLIDVFEDYVLRNEKYKLKIRIIDMNNNSIIWQK